MTTAVRERPILFSGPMVRAILYGLKTQTRRVVKPQPLADVFHRSDAPGIWYIDGDACHANPSAQHSWKCPYGRPGDRLWVRETWWSQGQHECDGFRVHYRSTDEHRRDYLGCSWRPSIHMPRWASRLTLEVTDVRVDRVQSISERDIAAEGVPPCDDCDAHILSHLDGEDHWWPDDFKALWDSINFARGYGWQANPWVWVVSFRKIEAAR